jgi:signal peptidase I
MFGFNKRRPPAFGGISADDDPDIEIQRPGSLAKSDFWAEARLLLRDLVFILMGAVLIVVFVVQPVKVEGTSMLPRLHDGERIFVNKLIYYHWPRLEGYGWPRLERGDIVVFWYPNDPEKSYVKRIIGLPGETVEGREGHIYVNGDELNEPYLDPQRNLSRRSQTPVHISEHHYFVMGDNRDNSSDSRSWGLVPEKYIYGKALFRYWPLGSVSLISHDAVYRPTPQTAGGRNVISSDLEDENDQ